MKPHLLVILISTVNSTHDAPYNELSLILYFKKKTLNFHVFNEKKTRKRKMAETGRSGFPGILNGLPLLIIPFQDANKIE